MASAVPWGYRRCGTERCRPSTCSRSIRWPRRPGTNTPTGFDRGVPVPTPWSSASRRSSTGTPRGFWKGTSKAASIAHVGTLLKTQLLELTCPQLLEQRDGLGLIGEQVELCCWIEGDLNRAVVNAVIDPVQRNPQGAGELRHGQVPSNAARVRLAALTE